VLTKTGIVGVVPVGKKFGAYIWIGGKNKWIGTFYTIDGAATARLEAENKCKEVAG